MGYIKKAILGVVLNGAALYALILLLPEVMYTGGFKFFVIGGLVVGFLNWAVKPVIKAVSLPFIFITGGLFLIVVNAVILWLLGYLLGVIEFRDVSLTFPNLGSYAIGAIVFGLINWAEHLIIKND